MISLEQVIERLNKVPNHRLLVLYKDGRKEYLEGYELKEKLLTGQIKLSELEDIQDLNYDSHVEEMSEIKKFLKELEWRLRSLMREDQSLFSWLQTILKVMTVLVGLFMVIRFLRGVLGGESSD